MRLKFTKLRNLATLNTSVAGGSNGGGSCSGGGCIFTDAQQLRQGRFSAKLA